MKSMCIVRPAVSFCCVCTLYRSVILFLHKPLQDCQKYVEETEIESLQKLVATHSQQIEALKKELNLLYCATQKS